MDNHQFDRLARALGSGETRRSLLRKLSVAGIGTLFASRAADAAATVIVCDEQYTACPTVGEVGDCCEGMVCTDFWDVETGGRCWPIQTCSYVEESCATLPCCEGMVCNAESMCEYGIADYCSTEEDWCGTGIEPGMVVNCCEGLECQPAGEGSACFPDPDYCLAENAICDSETSASWECCDGLVCNEEGHCAPPVTCIAEGEPCGGVAGRAQNGCCDDLICIDSDGKGTTICGVPDEPKKPEKPEAPKTPEVPAVPVTRLPDTGAGIGDADASWVAPAVMGAAAAVLGGKVLQNMKESQDS